METDTTTDWEKEFRNKWEGGNASFNELAISTNAMDKIIEDIHQQLQKARESERERIIAFAEDVEVTTAFGYDPVTIKMIDLRKIQTTPLTN